MKTIRSYVALGIVGIFLCLAGQPAVAGGFPEEPAPQDRQSRGDIPAPLRNLAELANGLLNSNDDPEDTDADGLPDKVERALGTDLRNPDSDFDGVGDYDEVTGGSNPNTADSNSDGLPDYLELRNISRDLDGDGTANVWDWDDDGDGVTDLFDLSPLSRLPAASSRTLALNGSGKPSYITFQIRSAQPDNMKLILQKWNWRYDDEGVMKDLDNSTADVTLTPMLELNCSKLSNQAKIAEYGITVSGSRAYVPLLPVMEFGKVTALQGKMFFPGDGVAGNLSIVAKLVWWVMGSSDFPQRAIQAKSGKYVTCVPGGGAITKDSNSTENSTFEFIEFTDNKMAFKSNNGMYLSVGRNGRLVANSTVFNDDCTFRKTASSGGYILWASNNLALRELANGTLCADSVMPAKETVFKLVNPGFGSRSQMLAQYYENFNITGLAAEESHGADAAVVYGANLTNLVSSQLTLAYQFLRNASNGLVDIPALLSAAGIQHTFMDGQYNHTDEALLASTSGLVPDALNELPDDITVPLIVALEETLSGTDLSRLKPVAGQPLSIDLAGGQKITVRSLKMSWYNTTENVQLEADEMVEVIRNLDLTLDAKTALIGLALAWSAGESCVVKINSMDVQFIMPEVSVISNTVDNIIVGTLDALAIVYTLFLSLETAYCCVQFNKVQALAIKSGESAAMTFSKEFKALEAVKAGKLGMLRQVSRVLEVVGAVIVVLLALWSAIEIIHGLGGGPTAWGMGVSYFLLEVAYAAILIGIASAGPPGIIIAALIALSDLLVLIITGTGWSQRLISFLVKCFVKWWGKTKVRSEVGLEAITASTDITDIDGNGLDVGDNITYRVRFLSTVTQTKNGTGGDLEESVIKPILTVTVPANSKSLTSTKIIEESPIFNGKIKTTTYNASVSVIPGTGTVNLPVAVGLTVNYTMYYSECWWWMEKRKSYTCSTTGNWTTLYFDVLPASLDKFVNWTAINSSDTDGDGINNTDEKLTNRTKWDTDADGLGDKFELQAGSDPMKADTDGDGLSDLTEMRMGTNLSAKDTDRDGISDYTEIAGAVITFQFCGCETHFLATSDPRFNDTDGDGVTDPCEYYLLLNPRSRDTDGNGFIDLMGDHGTEKITFDRIISTPFNGFVRTLALSPDGHLFGYQWRGPTPVNYSMVKYDTNGTVEGIWTVDNNISDMAFDSRGYLYVLHYSPNEITKYDSSFNKVANWSIPYRNTLAIDSSGGIVYVTDWYCTTVYKYNLNNMTFIGTMNNLCPGQFSPRKMDVDRDGNLYIPFNSSISVFNRNGTQILRFGKWGQTNPGDFDMESAVRRCPDGDILVADTYNDRLQKFSPYGQWRTTYGPVTDHFASNFFDYPDTLAVDDEFIYLRGGGPINGNNILKLRYKTDVVQVNQTNNFTDTDGDGLSDVVEKTGWNITVSKKSQGRATITYNVTSDPNTTDSDCDGLPDGAELASLADPRSADTDADGISDGAELGIATNITLSDTDGDGLDDGAELGFGSDPENGDTDGEGLGDLQEYLLGSCPTDTDSDSDGLDDSNESLFGSDPNDADSDDDFLFDGDEKSLGTDPWSGDSDGDDVSDGYEGIYGTDPKNNDTDGDGLEDGYETVEGLDPNSPDTDGDGLSDGVEVWSGLNPFSDDSNGNGVPDALDLDTALDDDIILVVDNLTGLDAFAAGLATGARVVRATPAELAEKYSAEPYIVLAGRPDAPDGTAGALIGDLLVDSGGTIERMLESGTERTALRYGVWAPTQTVMMLSEIQPFDDLAVLAVLRGMNVTVTGDSVIARYITPGASARLDDQDTARATNSAVWARMDGAAPFNVTIARYNASSTPAPLDYRTGLPEDEWDAGRYLGVTVDGGKANVAEARLEVYYTARDLDRTGDGDADDPGDLNESTLSLYWYNGTQGSWRKLSDGPDGVKGTGVNTTDVLRFGVQYMGFLWADTTHLSLFGTAGRANAGILPAFARAGADLEFLAWEEAHFNGSLSSGNGAIVNYTWAFVYDNLTVNLYGAGASFTFLIPGMYTVTLTVKDPLGYTASDTLSVSVRERPGGKWFLRVGPVTDENGTALAGAFVNITAGTVAYSNTTDTNGWALFEPGPEMAGRAVTVTVSREGYVTAAYSTNITAGRILERHPPPLAKVIPEVNFTLSIGPVLNQTGMAVTGALICIIVDGMNYTNTTDALGVARFLLPLSAVGKNISLRLEKKGYYPTVFDTKISADRKLEQEPPALRLTARPAPAPDGTPAWAAGAGAAAAAGAVAVAGVYIWSRKRKPGEEPGEPPSGVEEE